jgi:cation:H+ antiporter
MMLPTLAILAGLALLVWSADRFVDGASATATHFSVPPLLVGMVIVGFGTSAPELVVSTNAACRATRGWRWAMAGARTSPTSLSSWA